MVRCFFEERKLVLVLRFYNEQKNGGGYRRCSYYTVETKCWKMFSYKKTIVLWNCCNDFCLTAYCALKQEMALQYDCLESVNLDFVFLSLSAGDRDQHYKHGMFTSINIGNCFEVYRMTCSLFMGTKEKSEFSPCCNSFIQLCIYISACSITLSQNAAVVVLREMVLRKLVPRHASMLTESFSYLHLCWALGWFSNIILSSNSKS